MIFPFEGKRPVVAGDAFVAPGATLVGDVTVGSGTSIWFGAVLRGDVLPIRVGARTSIQDGSILHTSTGWAETIVGDDVTVGHAVILHGTTVRDRVIVGMGSILLDGSEIGSDTILGAGSLVTTRTRIPGGVLALGRPATVVRDLRPDELVQIRESAAGYVERARAYLKELSRP